MFVASGGPRIGHQSDRRIMLVVLENHGFEQIIGNSRAPYLNSLAKRYGLATGYTAVAHPSLPNYLALIGGDTFGITSDCTSCSVQGKSLADQLTSAHISWSAFMEGMPSACYAGAYSGTYAKKHDPFVYFRSFAKSPDCSKHVVPLRKLNAASLPSFSFVTPDECHDMHDCSINASDAWLKGFLSPLISGMRSSDIVVVTFDENGGASGNRVATILVSPRMRSSIRSSTAFTHYSLLRSIEDRFGLQLLRKATAAANMFRSFNL